MNISLKRVYEAPSQSDGCRILVERLWPRGVAKVDSKIDLWPKEVAPSSELRKWFNHDPNKWTEFKKRYFNELDALVESLATLVDKVRSSHVTFVFSARETQFNNAVALKEYIERLM